MSSNVILIKKRDKIATIVLNRPNVMNAMSQEMIRGLYDAVKEIALDETVHVLVLRGAGDHFSSGSDANLFSVDISPFDWLAGMREIGQIVQTLREMPQPIVTMLKGVAIGGGANLALAGDFVIVADSARFCEIFVNIGLILDYGGNYFLPRLVGLKKARELAMLGDEINGKTAASIGLVYKSVPEDQLEREVYSLARILAQKPKLAMRFIKEGLENSFNMSLKEVLDWEAAYQSIALQTPEHKEIVRLFLEAKGKK